MSEPGKQAGRVTVRVYGLTDAGQVRDNNEDAYLIADLARTSINTAPDGIITFDSSENPVLLAVSDGLGGAEAGEIASALVVQSLRQAMTGAEGNWDEVTREAVERANREVWNAARTPGRQGMGATLTAVCVHGDRAHIAEVGDSRAYVIRGGRIRQITDDQSFVQILLEAGVISPKDVDQHPMKNLVLQAMGQQPEVKVAIGWLELRRGDRLLLCSDGLTNKVSDDDIRAIIEGDTALNEIGKKLVALANSRGGEDNITVILADLDGTGLARLKKTEAVTQTLHVVSKYTASVGERRGAEGDDGEPGPPDDSVVLGDRPPPYGKIVAVVVPLIVLSLVVVYMLFLR